MGAVWGITPTLGKIIMEAGHRPFGILVWTLIVSATMSGVVTLLRGKGLPINRQTIPLFFGIAILGEVVPHFMTYTAVLHLPAGIVAIGLTLVPMFAMPIALGLGLEKPAPIRFLGTILGAVAILLIVGPDTGLPDPSKAWYVLLVIIAAFCYGGEGNFLTWYGDRKLDAMQILFGASLISLLIAVPNAIIFNQFINPFQTWHLAEFLILLSAIISAMTYVTYIWLIGQAGPVFSSQVAYLVTGFGVIWSMALLGERFSFWVWMAFVLMIVGISLVQPRESKRRTS